MTLEAFQAGGIEQVISRIVQLSHADEVTITPYSFQQTGIETDARTPALDVDGEARELERPLWGRKVLYGKYRLSYAIDERLYSDTRYRPPYDPIQLDLAGQVGAALRAAGLGFNIHDPIFRPPQLDPDCSLEDAGGVRREAFLSGVGCLNNPEVRSYASAFVLDLAQHYRPDGLSLDWVEFTPYRLEDCLLCHCVHCQQLQEELGFDSRQTRISAANVFEKVREKGPVGLGKPTGWGDAWSRLDDGVASLFEFKRLSVVRFVKGLRDLLVSRGLGHLKLRLPGFAWPMCIASGLDYTLAGQLPNVVVETKMYRFHWGLMVRWYANDLSLIHGNSSPADWVPFVLGMLELESGDLSYDKFRMPRPDEIGAISLETERKKQECALEAVGANRRNLGVRVHGYGPRPMFQDRLKTAALEGFSEIGVQRFGYLSDEKLTDIGRLLCVDDA